MTLHVFHAYIDKDIYRVPYVFIISAHEVIFLENKSANALALCHPPSASFCSVLAGKWSSCIFTHDRYKNLSDILTEFEVNLGIIIEKHSFPMR